MIRSVYFDYIQIHKCAFWGDLLKLNLFPYSCAPLPSEMTLLSTQPKPLEQASVSDATPTAGTEDPELRMLEKRSKVIEELLQTEKDYIKDLQMCVEEIIEPMQKKQVSRCCKHDANEVKGEGLEKWAKMDEQERRLLYFYFQSLLQLARLKLWNEVSSHAQNTAGYTKNNIIITLIWVVFVIVSICRRNRIHFIILTL